METVSMATQGETVDLAPFRKALDAEGFRVGETGGRARILVFGSEPEESPFDLPDARELAGFVTGGGGALLCLLGEGFSRDTLDFFWTLHLGPAPGGEVSSLTAEPSGHPACEGLSSTELKDALPVTGVGYALFSAEGRSYALGGPRGAGRVVVLGSASLLNGSPAGVAFVRWICGQSAVGLRS